MTSAQGERREHARVRVVVVDDSSTVRSFIARWLSESDDIELVGAAANGLEAISLVPAVKPDVVILDIEMPQMNGLEALPLIRIAAPQAAVIISSRLTRKNAELTLRCLQGGATEVVPKPGVDERSASLELFRTELMHKVRMLGRVGAGEPRPEVKRAPPAPRPAPVVERPTARLRVVAPEPAAAIAPRAILVGASTGGPNACAELIGAVKPLVARCPVVIAQHMPPVFTRVFAEHLSSATGVRCREAVHNEPLRAGHVYVGPGGHHITVAGSLHEPVLAIDARPPVRFSRPSVDLLFLSARDLFGAHAIGVVLTGMGSDGLEGARAMAAAGARIYAQDEASSVVWGMPGAVSRAGVAHAVMAPAEIAKTLLAAIGR